MYPVESNKHVEEKFWGGARYREVEANDPGIIP